MPRDKWNWRDYLTPDERDVIDTADAARAEWLRLNATRAGIQNRAIQRAKWAAARVAENPQVVQPGSNCFDGAAAYEEYQRSQR